VAFFFKQWGGVHKSTTGRILHERTYDEMPERVVADMPEKKIRIQMAKTYEAKIALLQQTLKKKEPRTVRHQYKESSLAGD
jgi:hypothetical protein